ncbi:hypothetical protein ACOYR1_04005 [Thalassotalea piscium]
MMTLLVFTVDKLLTVFVNTCVLVVVFFLYGCGSDKPSTTTVFDVYTYNGDSWQLILT